MSPCGHTRQICFEVILIGIDLHGEGVVLKTTPS
jgi:hypothetical protein